MFDPDAITDPTLAAAAAEAPPRALIQRQLAVLGRVAEAGLAIALAVERQALAAEAVPAAAAEGAGSQAPRLALADAALAYGRVSRAVRLTIALQARVLKDLQAVDEVAGRMARAAQSLAEQSARQDRVARKARVERIVERLIREEAADEAQGDRLTEEAYERLEDDDIYGDLATRPVREIIAQICRDLGLSPDWSRLAQEAWAQDATAARDPIGALHELERALAGPATAPPLTPFCGLQPPGGLAPRPPDGAPGARFGP
jgi:hypothetical protein